MKNNKLFCILGKSGAGKTTVADSVSRYTNTPLVVTSTSRPIREGEINGVDYFFRSRKELVDLHKQGLLAEYNIYNNWLYATEVSQVDLSNSSKIIVVDINGYEQLKNVVGEENVVGIYLSVSDKERLLRALNREDKPNCGEICRRFMSDKDLFKPLEQRKENLNFYKVKNNGNIGQTIKKVCNIIHKFNGEGVECFGGRA